MVNYIRCFFENEEVIRTIELNTFTKIEGYSDIKEYPSPIVIVKKVYQVKDQVM